MILGYRLTFDDGSWEEHVVARGSEEECRRSSDLLSAVSYSGPKRVVSAVTFTEHEGATGAPVTPRAPRPEEP